MKAAAWVVGLSTIACGRNGEFRPLQVEDTAPPDAGRRSGAMQVRGLLRIRVLHRQKRRSDPAWERR